MVWELQLLVFIMKVPYQNNTDYIVALVNGSVDFYHPYALPKFESEDYQDISEYLITPPNLAKESFKFKAPIIAFIETTNKCNIECDHCYAWSGPNAERKKELTKDEIFSLLDKFEEMGVIQVFLSGGEIFTRKDAVDIINYAGSKKFLTNVFTNGLLINRKIIRKIENPTSFFVSFDTALEENTIRGKMNYKKLKFIFDLLLEENHKIRTAISAHGKNVNDIVEIFKWSYENNLPRPQWLETVFTGRAMLNESLMLEDNQLSSIMKVYDESMNVYAEKETKKGKFLAVDTIKFTQGVEQLTNQEKCSRSVVYVNSVGDIYPCSNCQGGFNYKAGNIREESFESIWESGFKKFRKINYDTFTDCDSCEVRKNNIECQFRCTALSLNQNKGETGCGASDYHKKFMIESNKFWQRFNKDGKKLNLFPNRGELISVKNLN